jgi:hypothetical protein
MNRHRQTSPHSFLYTLGERGQFVPITAMIAFGVVVFMVATVNVYKISRAKLKVQNLADAAALNLASQKAQSFNIIANRNKWLNTMVKDMPVPESAGDCAAYANDKMVPPIVCAENPGRAKTSHIFFSYQGAVNYASLIQTMNEAQRLYANKFNDFLGVRNRAPGSSAVNTPQHFSALLKNDIPDLNESDVTLIAWDTNDQSIDAAKARARQRSGDNVQAINMNGLSFKTAKPVVIAYRDPTAPGKIRARSLTQILFDAPPHDRKKRAPMAGSGIPREEVGWMVPDQMQTVKTSKGNFIGAGVIVTKRVNMGIFGTQYVAAKSVAYVVPGSGSMGDAGGFPKFEETYWAKLAN